MTRSRRALGALGIITLLTGAAPGPISRPCITETEAAEVSALLLPDAMLATKTVCAKTLPPTALIVRDDSPLRLKYKAEAERVGPTARVALAKIAYTAAPPMLRDPELIRMMVVGKLSEEIKTKDCAAIERVVTLLEPLPAANTAQLLAMLIAQMSAADIKKGKTSPFPMCPSARP